MKSYWFLSFSLWYENIQGPAIEIKGNAVYTLPSKSFLPGTVSRTLTHYYRETLFRGGKIHQGGKVEIYFHQVLEVEECAVADFENSNSMDGSYIVRSAEYLLKAQVTQQQW